MAYLKKRRKTYSKLFQIIFILSIFSLILFLRNYYLYSSFSYFLLPTRFWEIGFGVITFLTISKIKEFFVNKLSNNLATFQFLGISIILILLFSENQFSQIKTLLIVLITSLFLISFNQESWINKILSKKILVYIGEIIIFSISLALGNYFTINLDIWKG